MRRPKAADVAASLRSHRARSPPSISSISGNFAPSTASGETAICPGRKAPRATRPQFDLTMMGSLVLLRRRAAKCERRTDRARQCLPAASRRRGPSRKPLRFSSSATATGKQLAFVYCEDEPGRRATGKLLTRDEARRIAANIAKLPDLLTR
jgi:hypothetical protein